MRTHMIFAGVAALALAGAAAAQPPGVGPPAPVGAVTTHTTTTSASHAMSITGASDKAARSKACSGQADAKGLHGKARKQFRSACKQGKAA